MNLIGVIEYFFDYRSIRPVVDTLAPLLFNYFSLSFNSHAVDFQMEHPFGFHIEPEFKLIRRKDFEVVCPVPRSIGIQFSAGGFNWFEIFASFNVWRSFKHKMFEKVSEPGSIRILVLASDMIENRDGNYRCRIVLVKNNIQPVIQFVLHKVDFFRLCIDKCKAE